MRKIIPIIMVLVSLLSIPHVLSYRAYEDNVLKNPSFEITTDWVLNTATYSTLYSNYGTRSIFMEHSPLTTYPYYVSDISQTINIPANGFLEACMSYWVKCGHKIIGSYYYNVGSDIDWYINGTKIATWSKSYSPPEFTEFKYECQQYHGFRGSGLAGNYTLKIAHENSRVGGCDWYIDGISLVFVERIKEDEVTCIPSTVTEGAYVTINQSVVNWQDGNPYTYILGYTYGQLNHQWQDCCPETSPDWSRGYYLVWADPDWNSGYFRDGYGDWRTLTINQGTQKSLARTMLFTYDYFEQTSDTTPDVFLSVRDSNLNVLSYWTKRDCFTGQQSTWDITQTSHQDCYLADCTPPIYPPFGANFSLRKCFRNDGATHTYHIRTRIGNDTIGWCNQDCIRDGKGVFVNETMGTGDIHCIDRTFTPPAWADPTKFYNVRWEVFDDNWELIKSWTEENVWQPSGVPPPPPFGYSSSLSVNSTWVRLGDHLKVTSAITNNGTSSATFTIGMSIGKWTAVNGFPYTSSQPSVWSDWCNVACYIDGLGNWTYLTIPAGETSSVSRVFQIPWWWTGHMDEWFDIAVGVYNRTYPDTDPLCVSDGCLVSKTYWKNVSQVVSIPPPTPPPVGIDAQIVSWQFSDTQPLLDDVITVKIGIRNTGNVSFSFVVGLSIGNESNLFYCNRDCYADGFGDYVTTGTIYPDETTFVQRLFRMNPDYFNEHEYYDVRMGVYHTSYLPYTSALGNKTLHDYIYISKPEDKLFAYSMSAEATPYMTGRGGVISIKSFILNNYTLSHNFTIGMSIGLWDAVNGTIYTSTRPYLLPPCNVECYVDELGDWYFSWIPPDYTAPVERRFKIPEYFLLNESFDVAVGVYNKPPEEGGKLLSIVYWKNISFTSIEKPIEVTAGEWLRYGLDTGMNVISTGFRISVPNAKFFVWGFITILVSAGITYWTTKVGGGSSFPSWQLGVITAFILILIGLTIGFVPAWIGLVFIVIAGLLVGKFIVGFVKGG